CSLPKRARLPLHVVSLSDKNIRATNRMRAVPKNHKALDANAPIATAHPRREKTCPPPARNGVPAIDTLPRIVSPDAFVWMLSGSGGAVLFGGRLKSAAPKTPLCQSLRRHS